MFNKAIFKTNFLNNFRISSLYRTQLKFFASQETDLIVNLDKKEDFEAVVTKSKLPVLIDFYADWCAPCKRAAPFLENKANELKNFKLVKINIDKHPELSEQFNVAGIPYLVLMKEGKKVGDLVGFQEQKLNNLLAKV